MQTKFLILLIIAVILSFVGGFMLANGLNRANINELNKKNAELAAKASKSKDDGSGDLTATEIEAELKTAASRPKDFNFQKRLAFELYGYAVRNKDMARLTDVKTLLDRAYSGNPEDYEVIVAYANLHFLIGKENGKPESFATSREFFEKALKKRPKDLRMMTDFAATLLESPTPDAKKAVELLEDAYEIDSNSELVVNALIKAHIAAGNVKKASELVPELKKINPQNPLVEDIDRMLNSEASK
ncbi:MAG: tetratricopeptide repeat protein [Pyrinomonadaceae bacterium]|nr:tetratricopeptide repeat protein [Pyrinomonadaceae bacterium]